MRLRGRKITYFKEGRLSITQYPSVLCSVAVVTLVRYTYWIDFVKYGYHYIRKRYSDPVNLWRI